MKQPHIAFIVTVPLTANRFLRGHLLELQKMGFTVTVMASPGPALDAVAEREGVKTIGIPMAREISPFQDIVSLYNLYLTLKKLKPDLVNASTPKAGLLGTLAARMARVPVRVYQQRGLRLETTRGLKRQVLLWSERLAASSTHYVICNSNSLRLRCLELGIAEPDKLLVLGAGSSNGIDTSHFQVRVIKNSAELALFRKRVGLPEQAQVIGFVGRLTKDKGIQDLLIAFDQLVEQSPDLYLLIIGRLEQGDPLPSDTVDRLQQDTRIILTGYIDDVAPYYSLMDVLAFPSYREGFPNVLLEAAASGVPVVGYQATGVVDAVSNGRTGRLVPIGDVDALASAMRQFLQDRDLRFSTGQAARQWVDTTFASHVVWQNWMQFYQDILKD